MAAPTALYTAALAFADGAPCSDGAEACADQMPSSRSPEQRGDQVADEQREADHEGRGKVHAPVTRRAVAGFGSWKPTCGHVLETPRKSGLWRRRYIPPR